MTVRFYIRTKTNNANIYVSVSLPNNVKYRKKTGFIIPYKSWNSKKQIPDTSNVSNINLGHKLVKLKNRINESFNECVELNKKTNEDWIDEILTGNKKGDSLVWVTENLIQNSSKIKNQRGGVGLSVGRIKIYKSFKKKIAEYNEGWKVKDVNKKSVEDFKTWLFNKGYSSNYVSSFVSRIKAVCNYSGIEIDEEVSRLEIFQTPKKDIITLSESDLIKLEKTSLKGELETARKWLLIGCQLGQRSGDLLKIDSFDVINGVRMIQIIQEKTGAKVAIPINERAWSVLKNGFPDKIPLYKFNKLIKMVCYRAKIKRHSEISSHVMRRSFATNYYGKIPTPILMGLTGHKKESTFLVYVGKSSLDKAFEAAEWFKKLG